MVDLTEQEKAAIRASMKPIAEIMEEIEAVLPRFTGVILQVPPRFSAIKVEGERAYDLARAGERLELEPREVEIERLAVLEMGDLDHTAFETMEVDPSTFDGEPLRPYNATPDALLVNFKALTLPATEIFPPFGHLGIVSTGSLRNERVDAGVLCGLQNIRLRHRRIPKGQVVVDGTFK